MDSTTPERPVRSSQRLANKQARTKRPSPSKSVADQAGSYSTDVGKRPRQAASSASLSSLPSTDTLYDAQTSAEHRQDTNKRSSRSQTAANSDSEVTSPGCYIQGTHLVAGGWYQCCRGCHDITAKSIPIWDRQVPLCGRCQLKYSAMVMGQYPPNVTAVDPALDPLCYWVPQQPPQPHMGADARKAHVDILLLQQDARLRAVGHQ